MLARCKLLAQVDSLPFGPAVWPVHTASRTHTDFLQTDLLLRLCLWGLGRLHRHLSVPPTGRKGGEDGAESAGMNTDAAGATPEPGTTPEPDGAGDDKGDALAALLAAGAEDMSEPDNDGEGRKSTKRSRPGSEVQQVRCAGPPRGVGGGAGRSLCAMYGVPGWQDNVAAGKRPRRLPSLRLDSRKASPAVRRQGV